MTFKLKEQEAGNIAFFIKFNLGFNGEYVINQILKCLISILYTICTFLKRQSLRNRYDQSHTTNID